MAIDRRQLMAAALGLSAATVTARPLAASTMSYEEAVQASRIPLRSTPRDRELVRFATLAANSHNTQPWVFSARGNEIVIAPDVARRCPAVDPDDHHLFVSLGCAAENLLLAASTLGWRANPVVDGDRIAIALEEAPPAASALADAIPVRQCTRAAFDGRPVAPEMLRQLEGADSRRTFRNEPIGNSQLQRFFGRDLPPSENKIGRPVQPDPARQQLGTPFARNQA